MARALILLSFLLVIELKNVYLQDTDQTPQELCLSAQDNCRSCIVAHPDCSWCADNRTGTGTRQTRCRLSTDNEFLCSPEFIENPISTSNATVDEPFSVIEDIIMDNLTVTQLRPQRLDIRLRKGVAQKVNLTFRRVVDYPLDLYYVMDLSYSMRDDLETLKNLGSSLVQDINNVTSNARLGFGTFVDKVMLPFAGTAPEELRDPCVNLRGASCAPAFGFHHQLSITGDADAFRDAVQATDISGNIDSPEGGFDALMQIAVCQDIIKWREIALRVILFTSDASPHIAMDGKLAAILEQNDMQCHLETGVNPYLPDAMVYSRSKTMDYPSIGQLKKAFDDNKVQTILAVTESVLPLYQGIPSLIANSYVDQLASDSSNVLAVISESYRALRGRLQLSPPNVPDNIGLQYRVLCPGADWVENNWQCDNVIIGDEAVFQLELTATSCPSNAEQTDTVEITSNTVTDTVSLAIGYNCDCDCVNNQVHNSPACNSSGSLQCGICSCNPGIIGLQCQCSQSTTGIPLEVNCTRASLFSPTSSLCSDHGYCECGTCQCDLDYFGEFCECRRSGCPEDADGLLCGGPDRGRCENCDSNSQCVCESSAGWYLNRASGLCTCNDLQCMANGDSSVCSGNGECNCDRCECYSNSLYHEGLYCERCVHPRCSHDGTCAGEVIRTCAECVYEQQRLRGDALEECASVCQNQDVIFITVDTLPNCDDCFNGVQPQLCSICSTFSDDPAVHIPVDCTSRSPSSDCQINYKIVWNIFQKQFIVYVQNFNMDIDCPEINPIPIILYVSGSIVLVGVVTLLLWKIFQTIRDKIEYQAFKKEARNALWSEGENPLFETPTTRIENPVFKKEIDI